MGSPPNLPPASGSGSSSSSNSNTLIPIVQQQPANSSTPPSDFSANSPTLFSFHTIGSLLFYQPVTRIVVVLTVLQSLLGLGGRFPEHCTSPSHVLYGEDYLGLVISPFVVPLTPALLKSAHQTLGTALLLAISNLVSFGLFEERLTTMFRSGAQGTGTAIFRNMVVVIVILVMGLRQLFGFLFSRALGWAYPKFFFSDSVHECNLGLAPFLFALLIVQAFLPDSDARPSSTSSPSLSSSIFAFRRIYVQIIFCLFNVIPKTIVWWAGSGLIVGFVVSLIVAYQRRMGRWGGKIKTFLFEKQTLWQDTVGLGITDDQDVHLNNMDKEASDNSDAESDYAMSSGPSAATPATGSVSERSCSYISRRLGGYVLPMVLVLGLILIGSSQLHNYRPNVPNEVLSNSIEPATPFLLTLIMMTAPRRDGITFIKQTLSTYLESFPEIGLGDPLYSRIQIVVYTHITDYPGFDEAQAYFEEIPKARKYVKWIREEGSEKSQRKHLISAIRTVGSSVDTVYLGIMEDDFRFCTGGWQQMLNTIYEANKQVKDHCGLFITTGGSGLIFKRSVAMTASFALEQDELIMQRGDMANPPDVALQNCMLGKHDYCSSCAGNMVVSKTLLQGHLGYNASTSGGRYTPHSWQCGWRHPFNGLPAVHTI
ncbi:hypothetical protein BGX29_007600 [Mortierella sp. GBA35]|nr:hypothetical protein BGX29_007600 [Mortierella sp. GBA35]KAG0219425.1 hypothetical protein BGX33_003014 [Mortierella sp. NVP41]